MQNSEYKPITYDELTDNEYLDIHTGQKANPYKPKLKEFKLA